MSLEEAQKWLDEQVIEMDWGYDGQLSSEQIDLILDGKTNEVDDDLWEENHEYIWESEQYLLAEAAEDFDVDKDELEPTMAIDMNLARLARNTNGYTGLDLNIEHDQYWETYEDVEGELEELGINPHDVDEGWPDIPDRDPLVTIKSLWELWVNCCYTGGYVALLNCGEVLESLFKGEKLSVLERGANLTIYNFWNGSGSMIESTIRDHKIDPKEIYNDGAMKYGIQSCYGLGSSEWNGILKEETNE